MPCPKQWSPVIFIAFYQGERKKARNSSIICSHGCPAFFEQKNFLLLSRGQMISAEDCEFIQRFEMKRSPEEKQEMLQTEGSQVSLTCILS